MTMITLKAGYQPAGLRYSMTHIFGTLQRMWQERQDLKAIDAMPMDMRKDTGWRSAGDIGLKERAR